MQSPRAHLADDPAPPPPAADPRLAREVELLAELAELGMDMARMVHGATKAAIAYSPSGSPPEVAELGRVFRGLAQGVRRTLALKARLEEGRPLFRRAGAPRPVDAPAVSSAPSPGPTPARDVRPQTLRRDELRAVLAPAIEGDPPERERLLDALDVHLSVLAARADFLDRSFGELVLNICRDLKLDADWRRWINAPWVVDAAAALETQPPPERSAAVLPFALTRGPP